MKKAVVSKDAFTIDLTTIEGDGASHVQNAEP